MTDQLMIPGPVELHPDVQSVLGEPQRGHLDPIFVSRFGASLKALRTVVGSPSAWPFLVSGSGTLALEMAGANFILPGEPVLVVSTGFFGERMAAILTRLGAAVTVLRAEPGGAPTPEEVDSALAARAYKAITITHVDTSTGVRTPLESYAKVAKARGALVIVDAVCSLGAEALEQDKWGLDVVASASQKALGAPPGLAVLTVSQRALEIRKSRKEPPTTMFGDILEWLPIMEGCESGTPRYYATPAVNAISALSVSLAHILAEGMPARVARHKHLAEALRHGLDALGLTYLPKSPALRAHTMSAVYYPAGKGPELVGAIAARGVTVAGGLLADLRQRYFRIGHMANFSASDIISTVAAVELALGATGGVAATSAALRNVKP